MEKGKGKGKEDEKINTYSCACAIVASMISIIFGYETGVMSGALIFIEEDFKINDVQVQVLAGIINFCALVGALSAGRTSDYIGRRYTICSASIIFLLGSLLMGFAPTYAILLTGRSVAGIGVGFALVIAPVYSAEISAANSRGILASLPELGISVGILSGYISNYFLASLPLNIGWRVMFGIAVIPSIGLAIGILGMPESPRWLVMQGRLGDAKQVLLKVPNTKQEAESRFCLPLNIGWRVMFGIAVIPSIGLAIGILGMPESPRWLVMQGRFGDAKQVLLKVSNTKQEAESRLQNIKLAAGIDPNCTDDFVSLKHSTRGEGVWKELLLRPTPPVRWMLLAAIGIHFFEHATGIEAVVLYSPRIFKKVGVTTKKKLLLATIGVGVTKTIFIFASTFFIDKSGRRKLLQISVGGMIVALLGLGFALTIVHQSHDQKVVWALWLSIDTCYLYVMFFSIGLAPVTWVYSSEIFPLKLRLNGVGHSKEGANLLGALKPARQQLHRANHEGRQPCSRPPDGEKEKGKGALPTGMLTRPHL